MGGAAIKRSAVAPGRTIEATLLDKIPPQNIEAEMAVLGAMMISDTAVADVIAELDANCFYRDNHRRIFTAIGRLYAENHPVDLITLIEQLRRDDSLEAVGGAAYLTELANSVATAANVAHHVAIVREKGLLRRLIATATSIVAESYEHDQEAAALLDKAETLIFEVASARIKGEAIGAKALVKSAIESIERLYQNKSQVTGVTTGYTDLDALTAGFQRSDLIILAGRPSMGKSALMGGFAEHAAQQSRCPTAIFSLEMSKESLIQRMLCSYARVNMQHVRTGFLSKHDWEKLIDSGSKLSQLPLFIDDTPGITVMELRAKARRLKAQYDIGFIILDYLQLMQASSGFQQSRQQEISDISRGLKALARELSIPIVALSQLSRAAEQRDGFRPRLSDLRDSGAIEQDADVVMLLFREDYYSPTDDNKGITEVIVAKQRNGPVGTVKLLFCKEFSRFENLAHAL